MKTTYTLLISIFLFITLACTPKVQRNSTLPDNDDADVSHIDTPVLPEEITPGGFIVEDPEQILFLADTVASNAEIFALKGDFEKAHRLSAVALDLITSISQEDALDTIQEDEAVFNRVAEFYVDLLPPSYLDSVPPTISSFVTRYQLYGMLNDMDSLDSSAIMIPYECSESATYNIPITYNTRVQQALTALLSSRRIQWMEKLMARAEYYRPFMNDMFTEAGLPTDLTFLPLLESAFNPKAYSPAHASGLWQFIPSTGKIFGLRNNYWVDERRDPIKATQAAIGYFTRLHGMFDDWYLALASYNCGEGRVSRTMKKSGGTTYWDLDLPSETMKYVPLFIAYQIIAKNPHCFGLEVDTTIEPFALDTVKVSDCIDLHKIAKGLDIEYDSLKSVNPHIKQWCTPPNMDTVTLYIPKNKKEQYVSFYKTLSDKDKVEWYRYRIRQGDVLGSIADRFDVSLSALKSINNMKSNRIIAGRYIFVPLPANSSHAAVADQKTSGTEGVKNYQGKRYTHKIKSGESLYVISRKYGVDIAQLCKWNNIEDPSKISVGQNLVLYEAAAISSAKAKAKTGTKQYYTVQSGESLYSISLKLGVTVGELAEWNNKNSRRPIIHPGDKLVFYGSPKTNSAAQVTAVEKPTGDKRYYTVSSGESLYSISLKLKVSVNELAAWNEKNPQNPIIHPGEKLLFYGVGDTKTTTVQSEKTTVKTTETGSKKYYRVESGESLYSISQKLGVSVADLVEWNNKDAKKTMIYPGEKLLFYSGSAQSSGNSKTNSNVSSTKNSSKSTPTVKYRVKKGDTMYGIAQTFAVSVAEIQKANSMSGSSLHPGDVLSIPVKKQSSSQQKSTNTIKYRVKSGDTLWKIATTFNVPVNAICSASGITSSTALQPGDILTVPVQE